MDYDIVTVIVTHVSFLGMETPQGADTLPCGCEAAKKPLCELLLLVKIYFDSGAPVNLKNKVCKKITATTMRKIQLTIFIGVDIIYSI